MFRRKVITLLILFAIYLCVVVIYMVTRNTESYKEYRKLIESNTLTEVEEKGDLTKQIRRQPEKNLWFTKGEQRLHMRLFSESSELYFAEELWSGDVIERLFSVRGWIQEELYYQLPDKTEPMQRIRYFESQTALLNYSTGVLTGDNVSLLSYEIPGHTLTENLDQAKITMRGIAVSVEIRLQGDDIGLKAGKIKANFLGMNSEVEADRLVWNQHDDRVVLEKNVHLQDEKGEIYADLLTLWLEKTEKRKSTEINRIVIEGNVQIENHSPLNPTIPSDRVEQYALADEVELFPETNTIILRAKGEGRSVLFFDKVNDLQISAPEVVGIRDQVTGEDRLQGKGKVRLSFIDEELESLALRFGSANVVRHSDAK